MSAGHVHTLAISDGKLFAWGGNGNGQIGDGTTTQRTSPVRIGVATNWVSVFASYDFSFAINDLGELWGWGANNYGQLGDGTKTQRSSPVKIGTQKNWVSISAGTYHALALNDKGEIWAWGDGSNGRLGDGATTQRSSPVRVGTATNWASVSAGQNHSLAINSLGELWAWGLNDNGHLGDGTTASRTLPVKIGNMSNWVTVSGGSRYTLAVNSLGELWAWGRNNWGQLGDGTTTQKNSPVKIGTQTNWENVSAGGLNVSVGGYDAMHSLAINTKGELYAWGKNNYGQIGDATTTNRTVPVRIGNQTNWNGISVGMWAHSIAINSSGELLTWGNNTYGQLGLNDTTNRSAPQLVSGLTLGSSVAVPKSVAGVYNVSAPSKTRVFPGDSYTFTVTRTHGTGDIGLELNTGDNFHKNGKLELTAVNGNVLTYTVSNVLFSITADDFSVATYSVESPTEKVGFTVSAPSSTSVLVDGSYSFVITLDVGYALPRVVLNTSNGKVNYSGVDQNGEMRVTISNVVGNIAGDNFTVMVAKI